MSEETVLEVEREPRERRDGGEAGGGRARRRGGGSATRRDGHDHLAVE